MNDKFRELIEEIIATIIAWLNQMLPINLMDANAPAPPVTGPFDWIKGGLLQIIKNAIAPPDIDDGPGLRAWILKLAGYLQQGADWTSNTVDNIVLNLALKIVANDQLWPDLYAVIHLLPHDCDNVVMDTGPDSEVYTRAKVLADEVGVDPLTIISIAMTVIKLIMMFRK